MSLQVWLPLTKDLRQQGVSNVSVVNNGATYSSTGGKLGGCYEFGTNKYIKLSNYASQFLTYDEFSLSVWFKCTARNTAHDGSALISGGNWNASDNLLNLALGQFSSDHYTTLLISGAGYWNAGYSYNFYLNTWYHVVLTSGNGAMRAYVNGQLIGDSYSSFTPGSLQQDWICIGNGTYTQAFHFNGLMNDVRIYDHCLSAEEVKRISQGLILHYNLNRNGWGQENLLLNTNDLTKWSKESTCTITLENDGYYHIVSTNTNEYRFGIYYDLTFPEVGTYTLSADVRTDWRIGFAASSSFGWTTNTITGTGNAQHITKTITTTSENNKCRIYITSQMNSSGVVTNSTYIKNIKVEKGSIATPWCPNSSDALADTMGLNSNIEYDTSGYCNNGTKNNSPTYSSDTAKYEVSTHLDGNNQTIQLPNLATLISDSIFTFNIWFKRLEAEPSSRPWETLLGGPSGFEIETCSANNVHDNKIKAYSWGGGTIEFEFDKWNMLTMVSNGTNALFYLNGELKLTGTYKALVSGNYFIGSWSNTSTQNYKGYVCDARIYVTALPVDDIRSLYQNCATIDSNGTIYGQIRT